ncbi:hypothetical protein CC86DRAFT_418471 [Ophiobolus disseminans]|uniref:Uncharacterized protein n=1 Tax=Ophiobolus disseminans TaxID=1469910 RepID=A0A6A6ZYY4_9PLEO|nr:hypothetical protein CC86DRAFT_418471 [Ophiobolus disseminans]
MIETRDPSRYQLIDSLHGPGTVGAWLLALVSVLISWTFNPSSRRKDTITVDLLAALLLPVVAAGHVAFLIVRLPVSLAEAFTTQDGAILQLTSAIEAPLCICETFSMAALVLALCCGPWWTSNMKWKRLRFVLVVRLGSWGAENVLFALATTKGIKMEDATLIRPYLFFFTPLVAGVWAYLALLLLVGMLHRVVCAVTDRLDLKLQDHKLYYHGDLDLTICALHGIFAPLSFVCSVGGIFSSSTNDFPKTYTNLLIPKSNIRIGGLDQIVALTGGGIVLLSAVWHAIRREEMGIQESRLRRHCSI